MNPASSDRFGKVGPTLVEVAQAAGVSLATASRALNGSEHPVSMRLARTVTQTAEALGYVPNRAAQAMCGRASSIGVLVSSVSDAEQAAFMSRILYESDDAGFVVMLVEAGKDPTTLARRILNLRGQRPSVIVLSGVVRDDLPADACRQLDGYESMGGKVVEHPNTHGELNDPRRTGLESSREQQ